MITETTWLTPIYSREDYFPILYGPVILKIVLHGTPDTCIIDINYMGHQFLTNWLKLGHINIILISHGIILVLGTSIPSSKFNICHLFDIICPWISSSFTLALRNQFINNEFISQACHIYV